MRAILHAYLVLFSLRSVTDAFEGLAVPFLPLSLSASAILGMLMILIGLIYLTVLYSRRQLAIDKIGGLLLAWVLSLAPWVYMAADNFGMSGLVGVYEWIRLLSLVLLYLVIYNMSQRIGQVPIMNAVLFALPLPLVVSYYQLFLGQLPVGSTMADSSILTPFLLVMMGAIIWKMQGDCRLTKALWGGLLALLLPPIVATVATMGWLMVLSFMIVMLGSAPQAQKIVVTAIALLFVSLLSIGLIYGNYFSSETSILSQIRTPSEGEQPHNTLERRLLIWQELFMRWKSNPIVGYGLNTAALIDPVRYKGPIGMVAHNDYVRFLVECGIFGFLAFIAFLFALGKKLLHLHQQLPDRSSKELARIVFALFIAWLVGALGDNVVGFTVFHFYLWGILAAASASAVPTVKENLREPAAQRDS